MLSEKYFLIGSNPAEIASEILAPLSKASAIKSTALATASSKSLPPINPAFCVPSGKSAFKKEGITELTPCFLI